MELHEPSDIDNGSEDTSKDSGCHNLAIDCSVPSLNDLEYSCDHSTAVSAQPSEPIEAAKVCDKLC